MTTLFYEVYSLSFNLEKSLKKLNDTRYSIMHIQISILRLITGRDLNAAYYREILMPNISAEID